MTLRKKLLAGVATTAVGVIGLGGTAFADHAHYVVITHPRTGVVTCQYLAAGVSEPAPDHPLHKKVHTGTPGSDERGTDFDKEGENEVRCNVVRRK